MPTGYTAGIIDGEIKTFEEFAKKCARAFGATIHMREESLDIPYKPAIPSSYHKDEIENYKKKLKYIESKTDEELIESEKERLIADRYRYKQKIKEKKDIANKLNSFIKKAKEYKPPTDDHLGIKKFMIEQLEETYKWDANTSFYEKEIELIENKLDNLDGDEIRDNEIELINGGIAYHTEQYQNDIKRCKEKNQWVMDFYESLKSN